MKNAFRERSWRLKRPNLHAKIARRKARKAKEAPKIAKLMPQMVPRPAQDASFGSLGGDFWVFLEEKLAWSWKLWIWQKHRKTYGFSLIFMVLKTCENRDIRKV